jgi:subtilisin family serine protease
VTAIDPTTEVLSSSNYGILTVDIAAPGQNILSCLPNNSYGVMTGTSQATAFVTGAAALVMSHKNQYLQAPEIKKYILATGDSSSSLQTKTRTSRQLNLFKALTILGSETGFAGSARPQVQDSFPSEIKQQGINSNSGNVKAVTQFGHQLLESLPGEFKTKPKKKENTRIGVEAKFNSN